MKKIPVMIPYIGEEEKEEVAKVLSSGWVAQGPKVDEFEKLVCNYENVEYGIAVTSCTTALHLALIALGADENCDCIVPSFTFVATPNSVLYTGATPVFVDVNEKTYNIDIESLEKTISDKYTNINGELKNKVTGNILKVIVAVNLFGLCADIPKINEIAKQHNIIVLEDSACAFGAKIGDTFESNFGNTACLSFHPRKSITTGEGGMILTNDEKIAEKVRTLRSHGASVSEVDRHKKGGYLLPEFNILGYNYRMTDIQAAVGVAQIKKMQFITETRRAKAELYTKLIDKMKIDFIKPPFVPKEYYHTYQSYVCVLDMEKLGFECVELASDFRNTLMERLENTGISTRVGTHATHMLTYYVNKFNFSKEDFFAAYKLDKLTITLPLYVQIEDQDQELVLNEVVRIKNELLGS